MTRDEIEKRVEAIRGGINLRGSAAWADLLFELQPKSMPCPNELAPEPAAMIKTWIASAIDAAIAEERAEWGNAISLSCSSFRNPETDGLVGVPRTPADVSRVIGWVAQQVANSIRASTPRE